MNIIYYFLSNCQTNMAKYPAAVINKAIAVSCNVVGMAVLNDKQRQSSGTRK